MDISIIIPTHNRFDFFKQTLESILAQDCNNYEVIVVDDRSNKEEKNLIKELCLKSNVQFVENSGPSGPSAARNFGAKLSTNNLLMFLDSDDLLSKDCIKNRLKYINLYPQKDMWIFGGVKVFNVTPGDSDVYWNFFTKEDDLSRFLRTDSPWHTSSPIWTKESFFEISGFDEDAKIWNDWDIHIRAIASGLKYIKIESETDVYYRKHNQIAISKIDGNISSIKNRSKTLLKILNVLKVNKVLNPERNRSFTNQLFKLQLEINKMKLNKNVWEIAKNEKLISLKEYYFWKLYLSLFEKNIIIKKTLDKVAYSFFLDHLIDIKSNFLKEKKS